MFHPLFPVYSISLVHWCRLLFVGHKLEANPYLLPGLTYSKRWCAYDPSALYCMSCRRQTNNHAMCVSVMGLAYWPMDLNSGPSRQTGQLQSFNAQVTTMTPFGQVKFQWPNLRDVKCTLGFGGMPDTYSDIYRRWILPRFSLSPQLIIIANKEFLDSFSGSIIKLTKEIFQVEDQIKDQHFNVARNHGNINTQVQRTKTQCYRTVFAFTQNSKTKHRPRNIHGTRRNDLFKA